MEANQSSGVQKAIKEAGSQGKLAKRLGVTQAAVARWVRQGYVPVRRIVQIEAEFGVARSELINPKIADLVAAPGDVL